MRHRTSASRKSWGPAKRFPKSSKTCNWWLPRISPWSSREKPGPARNWSPAQSIRQAGEHGAALIPLDCGAIPEALFESELFGYEKGSFTGAMSRRAGKFEMAQGGTLFLDEVGNMPLNCQAKLLRAIQERTFFRVGGKEDGYRGRAIAGGDEPGPRPPV